MAEILLVPLSVVALPVTSAALRADFRLQQPMADFSALPSGEESGADRKPYDGSQLGRLAPPFGGEAPPSSGVHLHWAVPRALVHGAKDAQGRWQTLSAPDRWLVTRLALGADGKMMPHRHFVVESNRLLKRPATRNGLAHPTVPVSEAGRDGRPGFRHLGVQYDLDGWKEDPEAERLRPFTALGHGSVTFAGYYPNSSTVFGLFDRLEDIRVPVRLIYQVTGWYTADDPLGDAANRTVLAEFWAMGQGPTPDTTVVHGRSARLRWAADSSYEPARHLPAAFALADHEHDALAALLADRTGLPELESFCAGLQNGLLQDGSDPVDALSQFRRSRQVSGFGALNSGREWRITPREAARDSLAGPAPLNDRVADLLRDVNRAERQFVADEGRLAMLRQDLFADWCRYQAVLYGQGLTIPFDPDWADTARRIVLEAAAEALALSDVVAGLRADAETQAEALRQAIPQDYVLEAAALPPFLLPVNPTLAFHAADIVPFDRHHRRRPPPKEGETPDPRLPCRRVGQIIAAISIRPAGGVPVSVAGARAETTLEALPPTLHVPLASLIDEAMLLDQAFARACLGAAGSDVAATFDAVIAGLADGGPWLSGNIMVAGAEVALGTMCPPLGFVGENEEAMPSFMPLFGQYELEYQADQPENVAPDLLMEHASWSIDGDVELALDSPQAEGAMPRERVLYRGLGIVADLPLEPLFKAAAEVDRRVPGIDLAAALRRLGGIRPMAMELSGLTASMLSLDQTPQTTVHDPYASPPRAGDATLVAAALGLEGLSSPRGLAHFSPIRAGTMSLRRCRLLDVFGRVRDDFPQGVRYALRMRTTGFGADSRQSTRLRPRLLHPARLDLQWLDPNGRPATNHPRSSPVFGWMLVNRMDNGLALFNPDGSRLFTLSPDGEGVRRIDPPGGPAEPANEELAALVAALLTRDGALNRMLVRLSRSLDTVHPAVAAENGNLALLVGRPLALARVQVRFETRGPVPRKHSWADFAYRTANDARDRDSGGVSELTLPLIFGDASEYGDGLVLVWPHRADGVDYGSALSPGELVSVDGRLAGSPLTLTVGEDSGRTFSVLVDPRAAFHVRCGLLPPAPLQLLEEHYAEAYGGLDLVFRAGPLLVPKNTMDLPVPAPRVVKGVWQWWTPLGEAAAVGLDVPDGLPDAGGLFLSEGWLRLAPDGNASDQHNQKDSSR